MKRVRKQKQKEETKRNTEWKIREYTTSEIVNINNC